MSSVDDARKLIASRRVVPQVVCSSKLLISTSSAPTRWITEALSGKIPTRFWTSARVGNRCRRSGFAWLVRGSVGDHETPTCRAAVDKGLRNLRWVRSMQLGYRLRDPRFATERFDEITAYNALAIRQAGARKGGSRDRSVRVPMAILASSSGWSPSRHPGDRPDGFASLSIASPSHRVDVSSKPSRLRSAARSETLDQEPLDRGGRPTTSSG